MDVRIKSLHFDASTKLNEFIERKAARLNRRYPAISLLDATLKVVKPETSLNKEVAIKVTRPNMAAIVATKTANTFEEAVDLTLEAIERQLEKDKE